MAGYALTPSQLSNLQDAVLALDAHLLRSVHALRNNEWIRPGIKELADYKVRDLVVCFLFFFAILHYSETDYLF